MRTSHHSSHPVVVKVSLLDFSQKVPATCSRYVNGHRTPVLLCSLVFRDEYTLFYEQEVEVAAKIVAMELSHDQIPVDNPWHCYHSFHSVHILGTGRVQCCLQVHHNLHRIVGFVDVLNEMISHSVQVTDPDRLGIAAQVVERAVCIEKAMEKMPYVAEEALMVLCVVEEEVNVLYVVEEEVTQLLMARSC